MGTYRVPCWRPCEETEFSLHILYYTRHRSTFLDIVARLYSLGRLFGFHTGFSQALLRTMADLREVGASATDLTQPTSVARPPTSVARPRKWPAFVGVRHNPIPKEFYTKLLEAGKPKKSALVACERKWGLVNFTWRFLTRGHSK